MSTGVLLKERWLIERIQEANFLLILIKFFQKKVLVTIDASLALAKKPTLNTSVVALAVFFQTVRLLAIAPFVCLILKLNN